MPGRYDKGSPPTQEDYTGHVKDESTGLHYAGARYYAAAFGRWNAVDPAADGNPSVSPYQYVRNNPLRAVDPNGKAGVDVVLAALALIGTPYEYGGRNPSNIGVPYSDIPTLDKRVIQRSKGRGTSWYNDENPHTWKTSKSCGIDCTGLYAWAFNKNPDLPSELKLNRHGNTAQTAYEAFKNNGGEPEPEVRDEVYLSATSDVNSGQVKAGDAVFIDNKGNSVADHVGVVGKVVRENGEIKSISIIESPGTGENVKRESYTPEELKERGFKGYGIINQNVRSDDSWVNILYEAVYNHGASIEVK